MKIEAARARIVLNSKAEPTIEVLLKVHGVWVSASSPSGTSTGKHEAVAWPRVSPDINIRVRHAKKVLEEEVFPEIVGKELHPTEVDEVLKEVDGTENFSRVGGNAALAVSIAALKGHAWEEGQYIFEAVADVYGFRPGHVCPVENVVGGGAHGGNTDIQEFLLVPEERDMETCVHVLSWLYREVKRTLREKDPLFTGAVTIESAFVTSLPTEEIIKVLSNLTEFISDTGMDVGVGLDVASSPMWNGKVYEWKKEGVKRTREEQIEYFTGLAEAYDLKYIEDPLHEDDPEGFVELQGRVKGIVVGDDLFATSADRLVDGVGGIIIKPNQRGTLSDTVRTIREAQKRGMKIIVSHRSGETEDTFLAHFAVGVGADYAKIGAAGIRITKLNELLRISELL